MLTLYRRHKRNCSHTDRYVKQDAQRCPIWVEGVVNGVYRRQSLKVPSWEKAKMLADELEHGKRIEPLTIADTFAKFLADCEARNLRPASVRKHKSIACRFAAVASREGLRFLAEVNVDHIRSFRASWPDAPITAQKKLERLRSAFQFFVDSDWIARNPARRVKVPLTHIHAVEPFSQEEQALILGTAYRLARTQTSPKKGVLPVHPKTGTFAKLLLHTALRITDAAMLTRERLQGDRIFLYATKNKRPVTLPLPSDLVRELAGIKGVRLFPTTGGSQRPETISDYWRDQLCKVFNEAGITAAHPTPLPAYVSGEHAQRRLVGGGCGGGTRELSPDRGEILFRVGLLPPGTYRYAGHKNCARPETGSGKVKGPCDLITERHFAPSRTIGSPFIDLGTPTSGA